MSRRRERDDREMTGANTTPLANDRREKPKDKPAGGLSLLNPSYLALGKADSPGGGDKKAITMGGENFQVKIMGGAGLTSNLDRPNMPAATLTMPVCIDRSRPPKREGETKEERAKRRRSRWTEEGSKTYIPGMPTMIPEGLSPQQEKAYLLQLKIEEASWRLRSGDLGIPPNPEDRSPSPEPIYDGMGKRQNTRDVRKRAELEKSRHDAIVEMLTINPDYKKPPDYNEPTIKITDKVMIPQDDHPGLNFMGLLIGPRGNTLKAMEKVSGCKIVIRGKGSVKEGKVQVRDQPMPGEDEPLHAYVEGDEPIKVQKAVAKIKEIIQQGIDLPEGSNQLRQMQLRELAMLNGTLREDGILPPCTNCGATDHRSWQCQDKPNVTNNIVCTKCGGAGHTTGDCMVGRPGHQVPPGTGPGIVPPDKWGAPGQVGELDKEYESLMAELSGKTPPPSSGPGDANKWAPPSAGAQFGGGPPRAPLAIGGPMGPPGMGGPPMGGPRGPLGGPPRGPGGPPGPMFPPRHRFDGPRPGGPPRGPDSWGPPGGGPPGPPGDAPWKNGGGPGSGPGPRGPGGPPNSWAPPPGMGGWGLPPWGPPGGPGPVPPPGGWGGGPPGKWGPPGGGPGGPPGAPWAPPQNGASKQQGDNNLAKILSMSAPPPPPPPS